MHAKISEITESVAVLSSGIPDKIGVYASTVPAQVPINGLEESLVADRLAEATAELGHLQTRREWWGYAPDEQLTIEELFAEKYQGKRPAVGYPSLPDTSVNFLLDRLLDMKSIGIRLTEHGAMRPHASVSGLMFAHPAARYFDLGPIGIDQLEDYARRRGIPLPLMKRFIK